MTESPSVIIIGGGLAGLAAACQLADFGYRPTLLEKRPFLGGRAYSYTDGRSSREVDNGQHVFLKCCTQYIGFLKQLGVYHKTYLQPCLRLPVLDKLTGYSLLQAQPLPVPFHLLPSFLRYRPLSPSEKLRVLYALARMRALDRGDPRPSGRHRHPELDAITFAQWLRSQGQTEHAIRNFWNLFILPALNDDIAQVSADLAIMVFQEALLRTPGGAAIGYAKVGLSALLAEAALRYLQERGGDIRFGQTAQRFLMDNGKVAGLVVNGETIAADYYLSTLPPDDLLASLPSSLKSQPFFARLARLEGSPIVNVHLWYDRPITTLGFAAFLNTPVQWVFNKTKLWGQDSSSGQYLDISLSGAHDFIDLPGKELLALFTKEIQALFPAARGAQLKNSLVVKQPRATFRPRPGIAALRPNQRTPISNLFLAGDWTDTGWPATMESAVRSGHLAAQALLQTAGKEVRTEAKTEFRQAVQSATPA